MKGEEGGGMRGEGRGEGEKGRNGDSTVKMQIMEQSTYIMQITCPL